MTRSQAFRQRKLNYRQALSILRDDQIEDFDDEIQRNVPKIDTGVEQGEQNVRIFPYHFFCFDVASPTFVTLACLMPFVFDFLRFSPCALYNHNT